MGKYDAIGSGSLALQVFERVLWKESDMDVFIRKGAGAEAFGKYLCEGEGYTLVAPKRDTYVRRRDLIEVVNVPASSLILCIY